MPRPSPSPPLLLLPRPLQRHTSPGHRRRAAPPAARPPALCPARALDSPARRSAPSRSSSARPSPPPAGIPERPQIARVICRRPLGSPRRAMAETGPGALGRAGAALMTHWAGPDRAGQSSWTGLKWPPGCSQPSFLPVGVDSEWSTAGRGEDTKAPNGFRGICPSEVSTHDNQVLETARPHDGRFLSGGEVYAINLNIHPGLLHEKGNKPLF
ncbi:uncharacterized protein LOC119040461 isoform X2 [Artibeus jamaicensis]|uniref:uncharacterized protein LOC119040461 isoform X2 n=1 Tax=Artibeus jamaicensis TaxID=9417 RepID=UPI00235B29E8|nr:uncharacterized protein LOC119040461 isoform X2 [Artibeus jamaicensis]